MFPYLSDQEVAEALDETHEDEVRFDSQLSTKRLLQIPKTGNGNSEFHSTRVFEQDSQNHRASLRSNTTKCLQGVDG